MEKVDFDMLREMVRVRFYKASNIEVLTKFIDCVETLYNQNILVIPDAEPRDS